MQQHDHLIGTNTHCWRLSCDGQPISQVDCKQIANSLAIAGATDCNSSADVQLTVVPCKADGCWNDWALHQTSVKVHTNVLQPSE